MMHNGQHPLACSTSFLLEPRTTGPGMAPPMMGWALPHQKSDFIEAFSQCGFLLSDDFSLSQVDIKLASTHSKRQHLSQNSLLDTGAENINNNTDNTLPNGPPKAKVPGRLFMAIAEKKEQTEVTATSNCRDGKLVSTPPITCPIWSGSPTHGIFRNYSELISIALSGSSRNGNPHPYFGSNVYKYKIK